jgi:WD40 repeat protein
MFSQVVTAADDSTIIIWDMMTGAKRMQINNAHGHEEITALSLDGSKRRLITGARNGSIKVFFVVAMPHITMNLNVLIQ